MYKKQINQQLMTVRGEDDEKFGKVIAICYGTTMSNILTLAVFGIMTIAMLVIYQEATLSSKTPSLIIFLILLGVDFGVLTMLFDHICFYEYGIVRRTLFHPCKAALAYDDIIALDTHKVWRVGRNVAYTQRYWNFIAKENCHSLQVDASSYRNIALVLMEIDKHIGPLPTNRTVKKIDQPM